MALKLLPAILSMIAFAVIDGCGQIAPSQEKTINFTLTNFKLLAVMVYYDNAMARVEAPNISTSKDEAETFVRRLIMQAVEDVLYEQGRSALLLDSVISSTLQQLDIQINYDPLKCDNVITEPMKAPNGAVGRMMTECIIIEGTVTNICRQMMKDNCDMQMIATHLEPIEPKYYSISGNLKTSNSIMASWSNQMWKNVLNRVLRKITSNQYGSHFYGASVDIR